MVEMMALMMAVRKVVSSVAKLVLQRAAWKAAYWVQATVAMKAVESAA